MKYIAGRGQAADGGLIAARTFAGRKGRCALLLAACLMTGCSTARFQHMYEGRWPPPREEISEPWLEPNYREDG